MQLVKKTKLPNTPVFDISVKDAEHYILENGIVTHNTGIIYSSDNIYIVGRQQEKDGSELAGYNFIVNVEKSRYVREKSKIPILVRFEGGLSSYTGLLELALESGIVFKPNNGWYSRVFDGGEIESKKWRAKDTDCDEFWKPVLDNPAFAEWVKTRYKVSNSELLGNNTSSNENDFDEVETEE